MIIYFLWILATSYRVTDDLYFVQTFKKFIEREPGIKVKPRTFRVRKVVDVWKSGFSNTSGTNTYSQSLFTRENM